jgi:hypothetical protein
MDLDPSGTNRPRIAVTAAVIGLAAFLWIAVAVELTFVVPHYERLFADFRVKVPWATEVVIASSRWCIKYWYVLIVLAIAGVGLSTILIRHLAQKPWLGFTWCVAILLLPLLVGFSIWFFCYWPYLKLLEGLQGGAAHARIVCTGSPSMSVKGRCVRS